MTSDLLAAVAAEMRLADGPVLRYADARAGRDVHEMPDPAVVAELGAVVDDGRRVNSDVGANHFSNPKAKTPSRRLWQIGTGPPTTPNS